MALEPYRANADLVAYLFRSSVSSLATRVIEITPERVVVDFSATTTIYLRSKAIES